MIAVEGKHDVMGSSTSVTLHFAKPGADAKKLFTSLIKNSGEPKLRLQIIH